MQAQHQAEFELKVLKRKKQEERDQEMQEKRQLLWQQKEQVLNERDQKVIEERRQYQNNLSEQAYMHSVWVKKMK